MNSGKRFEENFKKSIPEQIAYIRLKDGGGWSDANNTRFTPKNECDFILYDNRNMFMLELKSHKGKSIPYTAIKSADKSKENVLHKAFKFVERLCEFEEKGVVAGFIFNFADVEETYYVPAIGVLSHMLNSGRKSFELDWARSFSEIRISKKMKVNYRYDVEAWCNSNERQITSN